MESVECPPTPLHLPPDGGESPKSLDVDVEGSEVDVGSPPRSSSSRKRPHSPDKGSAVGEKGREGTESPEPNCAICLGKLENKSFTDSCFHQFCFTCLLEWSKVKAECPLCKQTFKSIIHSVRSIEDYDQYHLRQPRPETPPQWPDFSSHFPFRMNSLRGVRLHNLLDSFLPTPRFRQSSLWMRFGGYRGQRATSEFREMVYAEGLWVRPMSDVTGRYRQCSPAFYRENPACTHRLVPWLNRELNALLGYGGSQVAFVLDLLTGLVTRYEITDPEFREHIYPYFGSRTDHFIHEFYCFARSPYDMTGYDQYAHYDSHMPPQLRPRQALIVQELDISSPSSSDNSDVLLLSPEPQRPTTSDHTYDALPPSDPAVPGPSGLSSQLLQPLQAVKQEERETDSDDCLIVGYRKPLHERTPEVVTLISDTSDSEEVVRPPRRKVTANHGLNWETSSSSDSELFRLQGRHKPLPLSFTSSPSSSSPSPPHSDTDSDSPVEEKKRKLRHSRRYRHHAGEKKATHTVSMVNVEQTRIRISSVVTRPSTSASVTTSSGGGQSDTSSGHQNHHHRKKHKRDKEEEKKKEKDRKHGKEKKHVPSKGKGKGKGKSKK